MVLKSSSRTIRAAYTHDAEANHPACATASLLQVGAGDTYRMKSAANPQGAGAAAVSAAAVCRIFW